ncbi:MAG: SoxY-related AACIE arm protein [Piscinibacter sp.]|nr:SoxY-related AACIE arm protein [Piscinibacter sp.]
MNPTRRALLLAPAALVVLRPAHATPLQMEVAIAAFTGGAPLRDGRVTLEIAALVENGNTVPVSVSVDSPMSAADHVQAIALFTAGNPQPPVAVFQLGPRSGRARVDTRMRLATSQTVVAVARLSDGSHWRRAVEVIVTLAACVES